MIKRIVILGHTGFIGSKIEHFLRAKHPIVEIIGKSYPPFDLAKDADALKENFDAHTAVIMLAAVKKQLGDSIENCTKNITMMANLCKVLEERPVGRFIYFSSSAVYGENNHNLAITEDTTVQPTSYYGIGKYASERMLQKVLPKGAAIIRPPQIYGPGDMPCYGPSGFVRAALNNDPITLWGDGSEKREFIFVEDIVAIVEKLLFSNDEMAPEQLEYQLPALYEGILNTASGKNYSYREILEAIQNCHPHSAQIIFKERTQPKVDHQFNNEKLKTLFPAFSFTPLSQGIKKMVEMKK